MGNSGSGEPKINIVQAGTHHGDVYLGPSPPDAAQRDDDFTDKYRNFMSSALDNFEFIRVDPSGVARRHRFSDGYVPLTLNQGDREDATVSVGETANRALRGCRRALIRGVAGSGKSTLLRWLGVQLLAESVPFLVELARFPGGRPPTLEHLVPESLRPDMPAGWVRRILDSGQGLLLLDGLDEVPPRERYMLEEWIGEHLDRYPEIRCFVTTRPSTVSEPWWRDRDFQRFNLLSMSRDSIVRYVRGWHEIAMKDRPDIRDELDLTVRRLLATLSNRPALQGMSANPLLCGLLCALHLALGEHLPESRKEVYDEAVKLLLSWRTQRHRRVPSPVTAVKAPLTDEELWKLFQRLAFWLVTNRMSALSAKAAADNIADYRHALRDPGIDPPQIVRYLVDTCGLLREVHADWSIVFLHRTFRDHLAGKEVVESGEIRLMLKNADKPDWQDVVVMAGAHASPKARARIIRDLLNRGRKESGHRDALYLLAAAILEQTALLEQTTVRGRPGRDLREQVARALAELIPPKTTESADQLAAAGPFVLDLMPGPQNLTQRQAALVVRTIAQIAARWNPPGVIEKMQQYAEEPTNQVLTQLLEAWGRHGDYQAYARDVLSQFDFSRFNVSLQNGNRIQHIGQLKTITTLTLRNDVISLQPLTELPRLRRLTLSGNTMTSLDHLASIDSLRVLALDRCSSVGGTRPVDLSSLAPLKLRRIEISGLTSKVEVAALRLHSLRIGTRLTGSLPEDLHVRHLVLCTGNPVGLTGIRGVRSLVVDWMPTLEDLAALPELRRLVVIGVEGELPELPDVAVLRL